MGVATWWMAESPVPDPCGVRFILSSVNTVATQGGGFKSYQLRAIVSIQDKGGVSGRFKKSEGQNVPHLCT